MNGACPVCALISEPGKQRCSQCGWELESDYVLGRLTSEAEAVYHERLEYAQRSWREQQSEQTQRGQEVQISRPSVVSIHTPLTPRQTPSQMPSVSPASGHPPSMAVPRRWWKKSNAAMSPEQRMLEDMRDRISRLVHAVTAARAWHARYVESALAAARDSYEEVFSHIHATLQEHALSYSWPELPWDDTRWNNFTPVLDWVVPRVTRFGNLTLQGHYNQIAMPALLPIIGSRNVLFKASGAAKDVALEALRSLMLRLLATVSPGKSRFVLIDPVGLGSNMAGFMRLPDELTGGRIWTEVNHIEQRLVDLSEHMETVIQKYLLNRYTSMEDYNEDAQQVAEPYRLLVIANFPTNFSESAARRLISIATNGPRTGVYVLALIDTNLSLPYGFQLSELERTAIVITHKEGSFVWQDEHFSKCLLELDRLPPIEMFDRIVTAIGEATLAGSHVQIPFSRIAPAYEEWWKADSRGLLCAPIGRQGAQRTQFLELGQGTTQRELVHALIVGQTGSGKSTLLHVLIISLSLTYSPDELELYLVDFKQGIEFKDYATHQLPHARVVAIQSEREFGISVLERLEGALQQRGDLFRHVGVTSLRDYRDKMPQRRMPRILLLVDEFQEFFTEDDRLASQAAHILDRLVRQGRAYGIHVTLVTQSLSGVHSMPRSTIDQMAVRIALQCSEADSRLIFGDDNPAARLLNRPGEAIYNDTNGLIEGNNLFQVVWLPDAEREGYLRRINDYAQHMAWQRSEPQIVFEGNAPALLESNPQLWEALEAPAWPKQAAAVSAWVGASVSIKPHTAALFRRQSRSHLLLIGQNEETAMGILIAALAGLAANQSPQDVKFYIVDLSNVDTLGHEAFKMLREAIPHHTHSARRQEVATILEGLEETVKTRSEQTDGTAGESIYLLIAGVHRARDLRREDTYSFTEPTANAAERLSTILRDGPDVGVHTLIWCDTLASLERVVQRRDIDEFDLRVALQMSASESNELLDSSVANKLGPHLAYFYDAGRAGQLEKFRPYGVPELPWITRISGMLHSKVMRP